jgi:hypothetical protein
LKANFKEIFSIVHKLVRSKLFIGMQAKDRTQSNYNDYFGLAATNNSSHTGLNMKKITVLTILATLAYAPISSAGTIVTNTGANGNLINQTNTAVGTSGVVQGGAQTGLSNQTLSGSATGSGAAVVVNKGINGNIINQSNTSIQTGYSKVPGGTFQGGAQVGVANQTLIGTASGSNAIVSNSAINGNKINQSNTSIQNGKKLPFVVQGGSQDAFATQTLIGTSSAVSVGPNTAAVFNEGANANFLNQDNTAIQNGKKIGSAYQGGKQFATATQTSTGVATSVELPVVVVKYPKDHKNYKGNYDYKGHGSHGYHGSYK